MGGFFAASHFLQDTVVRKHTTQTLTRLNGAQVDLESLSISILGGDVAAAGLQVTDANQPSQNQVVVENVAASASVYDLLLGRLVMENVEVTGMKFNQARETPGEVVETPTPEEEPFDPNEQGISQEDVAKLEKYFKDAKKVKQWLQKVRQWLPEGKDGDPNAVEEAPQTYLEYLRAKAAESPTVKVLAKRILADKVEIPSELFGNSEILMTNLSDAPSVLGEPVTLSLKSHDTATALNVTMDYSKGDSPAVSGTFEGFDLSKVQSNLGQDAGVAFQSGTASGTFTGMLTKEIVDLTVEVKLSDLKATSQGDGVLGLGAEQTSRVMEVLKELGTTISNRGARPPSRVWSSTPRG